MTIDFGLPESGRVELERLLAELSEIVVHRRLRREIAALLDRYPRPTDSLETAPFDRIPSRMFLRGVDYILAEGDEFLVPASEGLLRTFGSKVGREQVVLHEFDGFGTFRNLDLFRDWGGGLLLDYEADEKRLGVLASTTIETIVDLVACIALSNIDSPPAILTFPPYVYSWEREPYDCMVPQDVFNGLGYSFGFRAGGRRLSVNDSGVILLRVKR